MHTATAVRILARAEHPVSRSQMSPNALKVLRRLHGAGFSSYLVGGAVRDLLLSRTPKDFDVGTNARPQQVRQLFRNARIIGRRFRLALITFPGEIVEVATFRRSPEPPDIDTGEGADPLAPVLEAEEFGTPEEDAQRRDFTVNGLFYNIADFSIIDHVGGLADLERRTIRSIGPARRRFVEDPVRMLRAIEYATRLGFELEAETAEAVYELKSEIRRAAPARIGYELVESLSSPCGGAILQGFDDAGLLAEIMPEAHVAASGDAVMPLWTLLQAADRHTRSGGRLMDETRLGLLFLPTYLTLLRTAPPAQSPDLERAIKDLIDPAALRLAFSHYRAHLIRASFFLLARLLAPPRAPRQVVRTVRHESFPVALELGRLVAGVDERFASALAGWESAAARIEGGEAPLVEAGAPPAGGNGRRRRRRRRGGRRGAAAATAPVSEQP